MTMIGMLLGWLLPLTISHAVMNTDVSNTDALAAPNQDSITLHLIPSPKYINWYKPQSLAVTAIKNQIAKSPAGKRHAIGHVYVELSCGGQHFYTGMTSQTDDEEREALLKHGYGLGILFKDYLGKLEDSKEVEDDLKPMYKIGRSSFLRFLVSSSTCNRFMTYLSEFRANGYDQIYAGLNARPLQRQGSGCSAFGMSFLELAGLQIPEFEQEFLTNRIVPAKFVGGPQTNRRVSVLKILFAFSAPWASKAEGNFPLSFWDPKEMDQWTRDAYADVKARSPRRFPWPVVRGAIQQSPGLIFDATQVATPTTPIFQN